MVGAIVAGTILSIVAAARTIRVRSVRVRRILRSQIVWTRIGGLHVEGQIVCLGSGEGGGVVDAEELVQEAGTFAALDVAAAAAGVVVSVERHWWERSFEFRRRCKEG